MAEQVENRYELNKQLAQMLKGGVIMDVTTPADATLMMQLGAEGVFVGSGIFKSGNPAKRARAIMQAVTNYEDPKIIADSPKTSARRWSASTKRRSSS